MLRPLILTIYFVLLVTVTATGASEPARITVSACPGEGYIAYSLPAIGSCPCGDDRCFHPGRYYTCRGDGDPAYKKAFWRRWFRAHFRHGSMLEGVPCECVAPPSRPIAATFTPVPAVPVAPPAPQAPAEAPSQGETPKPPIEDPFKIPGPGIKWN